MALINCPECRREFSSEARACPQCGRPGHGQSIFTKELGADGVACGVMIVAGLVIVLFMGMPVGILLAGAGMILLIIVMVKK